LPTSIFDQAMALPYHLYVISTSGTDIENQERWLMVLVLIIIVLI
jgi:phosphate transport system permease protein